MNFRSSSRVRAEPESLFLNIASTSSTAAGAYMTASRPWSETLHPMEAKKSILLIRAAFKSAKEPMGMPLTSDNFAI